MRRRRLVAAAVATVLGVSIAALALVPPPGGPPLEPDREDSELYHVLADAGIEDAVVEITDEHALVRYEVPAAMNRSQSVEVVLRETAAAAPDAPVIVLQVYEGYEPAVQVTVETEVVLAYVLDGVPYADVEAAMETSTGTTRRTSPSSPTS